MAKKTSKPGVKKATAKVATKTKPKPKPKPAKIDWVTELRSGQPGVKKWNRLATNERAKVKLVGVDLSNTDLTGVKFSFVDLSGVNLTGATLDNAALSGAKIDETTKWPAEVKMSGSLYWKGKGPDPRKVATPEEKALPKPADFTGFMSRLKQVTDPAKLDKATAMLRAERFRLYAKVASDHLVGVVKSQSDPDL